MTIYSYVKQFVWDDENKVEICIQDFPDAPEIAIEIICEKPEYYGFSRFSLGRDVAEQVAYAILKQLKETNV